LLTIFAPLFEWVLGADRPDTRRPDTLGSWNNLAMSDLAAGQAAKAIPLFKRTLADCERVLGADHPNTLRSRNNLAMSYQAAGQPAKAISLLERTIADCERVLGANHPDTKAARANLAALTGEPKRPRQV
jgi:tetratricopeptide (TPR) repeat protein